jgi:SAM-dependent methyltransferase
LKLNLGCGKDIREGYVNVDIYGDVVNHDLNVKPWPFENDCADEILLHNVLEHLPDTCSVMRELYRVCKDGAIVHIAVPHPLHDDFISDPTHVSRITGRTLQAFSKKFNDQVSKDANQPLAYLNGVDFEIDKHTYVVEPRWMRKVQSGEMSEEQLQDAILTLNNVVKQIEIDIRAVK